jgi:hypothetical protein
MEGPPYGYNELYPGVKCGDGNQLQGIGITMVKINIIAHRTLPHGHR